MSTKLTHLETLRRTEVEQEQIKKLLTNRERFGWTNIDRSTEARNGCLGFSNPIGTGLDLPFHNFAHHWPYINREYQSVCAYFPVNTSRPHVACLVADSMEASTTGGQALRSDVDYAIAMVLWQLSEGQHTNHHTKPALIYTLERDQHARITQAHFDSKRQKLVLRQSRHLDLSGPEPTPDAFLLLRWIACRPAGETEYPEEGGDGGGEEGDGDRDGGDGDGDGDGDGGEGDPPGVAPRLVVVGCA
ncbi:predicted protein [Chaetomium globosum CBS 148.51]|uniref:Uncharacterized protein n=1 Tax=Chaetomium globosum (strain ATCC 6205 / CBS 148.51 / DSM 1962 / NBRC 6347 / NRRL 1970) TaxID=306901 RepID=Q2GQJ0_CHAGB|nr:uncharacterized protein CHGG_09764 [Chaetomium globosum CBS 148.51]EAQ83360.1 predicted protein [Chaetomium globosum CBS 148.51]